MPNIVIPTVEQEVDWEDLRKGIKDCITAALTVSNVVKARIYSSWPLKYDVGQTVDLLESETDDNKVHAWIIGINRTVPRDGGKSSGHYLEWPLQIRVWGFLGFDGPESQNTIEDEVRKITRVIYANSKTFGQSTIQGIKSSGIVSWEEIDTYAFSAGNDVLVAKGSLEITIREHYSGY
jgi:hypothetical protein